MSDVWQRFARYVCLQTTSMRALFTAFIFIVSVICSKGQSLSYDWHYHVKGEDNVTILSSAVDQEGNSILAGSFAESLILEDTTFTTEFFATDGFLIKLDPQGEMLWIRAFKAGEFSDVDPYDIMILDNNDILITGSVFGEADMDPSEEELILDADSDDMLVARYSADGELKYANNLFFGDGTEERVLSMDMDADGALYLGGYADLSGMGNDDDPVIVQTFPGENEIEIGWSYYLDSEGRLDGINEVTVCDDHLLITGSFMGDVDFDPGDGEWVLSSGPSEHTFMAKLSLQGELIWAYNIGSPEENQDSRGRSIACDANGDIYITGEFYDNVDFDPGPGEVLAEGFIDSYLLKLNTDGEFQWVSTYDNIRSRHVKLNSSGAAFVAGEEDGFVTIDKYSSDGEEQWMAGLDASSTFDVNLTDFSLVNDQEIYLAAEFSSSFMYNPQTQDSIVATNDRFDAVYVKLTENATTAISQINFHSPVEIFPNPVTDYITLNFKEEVSRAHLYISDVGGHIVFDRKIYDASSVNIPFQFPSGPYYVRIDSDTGQFVQKVVKAH